LVTAIPFEQASAMTDQARPTRIDNDRRAWRRSSIDLLICALALPERP
jgi:hypothetical protein